MVHAQPLFCLPIVNSKFVTFKNLPITGFKLSQNHLPSTTVFFYTFKKMGQLRPHFRLFSVFLNKQYNSYNNFMWKNVMPIQYMGRDLNPRPLEHESPPITTRPRFPPINFIHSRLLDSRVDWATSALINLVQIRLCVFRQVPTPNFCWLLQKQKLQLIKNLSALSGHETKIWCP